MCLSISASRVQQMLESLVCYILSGWMPCGVAFYDLPRVEEPSDQEVLKSPLAESLKRCSPHQEMKPETRGVGLLIASNNITCRRGVINCSVRKLVHRPMHHVCDAYGPPANESGSERVMLLLNYEIFSPWRQSLARPSSDRMLGST